jgi:hypothetical protein
MLVSASFYYFNVTSRALFILGGFGIAVTVISYLLVAFGIYGMKCSDYENYLLLKAILKESSLGTQLCQAAFTDLVTAQVALLTAFYILSPPLSSEILCIWAGAGVCFTMKIRDWAEFTIKTVQEIA